MVYHTAVQTDFLQPLALSLLLVAVPGVLLFAERNRRVREAESRLVGISALFGYFFLILAVLMTVLASWSAVNLYAVWISWPGTDAQAVESNIVNSVGSARGGFREFYELRCTFRYAVSGQEHVVTTESRASQNRAYIERLERRYCGEGGHFVHYRPSAPEVLGLVDGSGEVLSTDPYQAWLALIFAALGCPFFLLAHIVYLGRKRALSRR